MNVARKVVDRLQDRKVDKSSKVEMGSHISATGTSRVGFLKGITLSELIKVFGKPGYYDEQSGDKIRAEWTGRIDGNVFTIYDYKEATSIDRLTKWHVGGRPVKAYSPELVLALLKQYIGSKGVRVTVST